MLLHYHMAIEIAWPIKWHLTMSFIFQLVIHRWVHWRYIWQLLSLFFLDLLRCVLMSAQMFRVSHLRCIYSSNGDKFCKLFSFDGRLCVDILKIFGSLVLIIASISGLFWCIDRGVMIVRINWVKIFRLIQDHTLSLLRRCTLSLVYVITPIFFKLNWLWLLLFS